MKSYVVPLLLLASLPAMGQYSPESFDRALSDLDSAIEKGQANAAKNLPGKWSVNTSSHTYSISTAPLNEYLSEPDIEAAHAWIAELRDHVTSFESNAPQPTDDPRKTLKEILSRSEFKSARSPSLLERLLAPVREWIGKWLRRVFEFAAQHPAESKFLFWALVLGAAGTLRAFLIRYWTSADRIPSLPVPLPLRRTLQSWQEWMAEARSASGRGDYRQAIRCSYWAGISRLQQERSIRIDFADTPRERLRLLAEPPRNGAPLRPEQWTPLSHISQRFERSWYANLPTDADEAAKSFEEAEALGCRAD